MKIIYNLSAQSVSVLIIGKSLAGSIVEIINYSTDDNKKTFLDIILLIMEFLVILIITFATLVYDEIIIIKKCNLDVDTRKGISKRLGDDLLQVIDTIRSSTEANLIETREGEIDIEESWARTIELNLKNIKFIKNILLYFCISFFLKYNKILYLIIYFKLFKLWL